MAVCKLNTRKQTYEYIDDASLNFSARFTVLKYVAVIDNLFLFHNPGLLETEVPKE